MQIHHHHPMDSIEIWKSSEIQVGPRLCGWSSGLLLVDCENGALEISSFPQKIGNKKSPKIYIKHTKLRV